jgi:hypothetical protein|tara:strand:+ start:4940 stop:5878 length:939 start_codon:yes stop_codon:yes gene_type:complete
MSVTLTLSNKPVDESWYEKVPLIDGFGTEGIGSMIQYHLLLSFFSDSIGVSFTYPGSENFGHHSYVDCSESEYVNSIDKFFNFPNISKKWDKIINFGGDVNINLDESFFSLVKQYQNSDENVLINLHDGHLAVSRYCAANVQHVFTEQRVDKIRNNLVFDGEKYFDDKINISWHVRTSNPNDVPAEIVSPLRELYFYEKDYQRYVNLINALKYTFDEKEVNLHIHSQGFTSDFSEFTKLKTDNFNIIAHLDDDAVSDLYHMSHADLFVMSNSSFSWVASLLNSNQKITRDNFTNGSFVFNFTKANYDFTSFT